MREETEFVPKPMLQIGGVPVLLHLIQIYARQGHTEFVILAGYKASVIKEFFSNLHLHTSDVRVSISEGGGTSIAYFNTLSYLRGLQITILDTGVDTLTGERLLMAREEIGSERFLATYGDGLAPVNMWSLLQAHESGGRLATLTVTRPENRFGIVNVGVNLEVESFREKPRMNDWINIGFFVFEKEIWQDLRAGESLEDGLLARLADSRSISAFHYDGFWQPMDTYREYVMLNKLWQEGQAPWLEDK